MVFVSGKNVMYFLDTSSSGKNSNNSLSLTECANIISVFELYCYVSRQCNIFPVCNISNHRRRFILKLCILNQFNCHTISRELNLLAMVKLNIMNINGYRIIHSKRSFLWNCKGNEMIEQQKGLLFPWKPSQQPNKSKIIPSWKSTFISGRGKVT